MDPLVRRARATVTEAWAKGRRTSLGLVGEQGLLQRCEVRYHGDLRCSQMLTRLAPHTQPRPIAPNSCGANRAQRRAARAWPYEQGGQRKPQPGRTASRADHRVTSPGQNALHHGVANHRSYRASCSSTVPTLLAGAYASINAVCRIPRSVRRLRTSTTSEFAHLPWRMLASILAPAQHNLQPSRSVWCRRSRNAVHRPCPAPVQVSPPGAARTRVHHEF
jgi:hypothetical protein